MLGLGVLGLAVLVQAATYLLVWLRVPLYRDGTEGQPDEPGLAIVVSARNERSNIVRYLPALLHQAHPNLDVVVANDRSYDGTANALDEFEDAYAHLHVVDVPEGRHYSGGKKLALALAFKRTQKPFLLLTDADCVPASPHWATTMHRALGGKSIVLGYGAYRAYPGLLNKLIRFDTLLTAQNYFGFALAGMPYMGVGRNLGYTRALFFGGRGFARHIRYASGDDDLFVNEHATCTNTAICLNPLAYTVSEPKQSYGAWFRQKRRHMGSSRYYKKAHALVLATLPFAFLAMWGAFPFALAFAPPPPSLWFWAPLAMFAFALGLRWLTLALTARRLHEKGLWWAIPLLDCVHFVFQFWWLAASRVRKQVRWS